MYKVYNSDTFKEVFYPLNININEVLASNISDKTIGNKIRKLRVSLCLHNCNLLSLLTEDL